MKILVTGATGFVGNYVIKNLIANFDHEIIATSRTESKAKDREWFDDVNFIEADLNERKENWFDFFDKPDLVIHLAWEGLPNHKELFHIEKNLMNNYWFIKNLVENGLKDLSVIGTCAEYGRAAGMLAEDTKTDPRHAYATAKNSLREFIEILQTKFEFDFKWLRLFYMYGEGQDARSILPLLDQAVEDGERVFNMSGGEQRRDYSSIEDTADYIVTASVQSKELGIINCCSGKSISILELVQDHIAKNEYDIEINPGFYPYSPNEAMEFYGDNSKFKRIKD